MTDNELIKIGHWLNAEGFYHDLEGQFWMEEYKTDLNIKDIALLIHKYYIEHANLLIERIQNQSSKNKDYSNMVLYKIEDIKNTILSHQSESGFDSVFDLLLERIIDIEELTNQL